MASMGSGTGALETQSVQTLQLSRPPTGARGAQSQGSREFGGSMTFRNSDGFRAAQRGAFKGGPHRPSEGGH